MDVIFRDCTACLVLRGCRCRKEMEADVIYSPWACADITDSDGKNGQGKMW